MHHYNAAKVLTLIGVVWIVAAVLLTPTSISFSFTPVFSVGVVVLLAGFVFIFYEKHDKD